MKSNPNEVLIAFSEEISREVLRGLGETNVVSIFLTGSVPEGRAAGYIDGRLIEVYSDLDMAVVVDNNSDLEACRRLVRRLAAAHPRETDQYRIFPTPDIGVFTVDDLHAQRARPGTVGIAQAHKVMHGSESVPRDMQGHSTARIDPDEALYLLENRLLESRELATNRLDTRGEVAFARYAHYVTLKNCLDAVSALLIAVGKYVPARDERMRVFWDRDTQQELERLLPAGATSIIRDCAGQMRNLQGALAAKPSGFAPARGEIDQLLLRLWKCLSARFGGRTGEGWSDAIRRRTRRSTRSHIRELVVLARRRSLPVTRVVLRSRRLARFAPVNVLRLTGLVESLLGETGEDAADDLVEKEYLDAVEGLTREFGFRDGTLFQRGRTMYRAIT